MSTPGTRWPTSHPVLLQVNRLEVDSDSTVPLEHGDQVEVWEAEPPPGLVLLPKPVRRVQQVAAAAGQQASQLTRALSRTAQGIPIDSLGRVSLGQPQQGWPVVRSRSLPAVTAG